MPFVSAHERLNRHFAVRAALGATIGEASATRKCLSLSGLLVVRIRLGHRKSERPFKGIICDDIFEFESYMASQPVGSLCCYVQVRRIPAIFPGFIERSRSL